jgi:lipid II:glycine glycyltransferase (peptidoglycan interpeptide bridge formation enzyme)
MEIKEIKNKEEWEGFLKDIEEKTFLQSWNWGEFQEAMGDPQKNGAGKIWKLGIYEENSKLETPRRKASFLRGRQNSKLMAVALVVKVSAKRGNFLLVPHGPIINRQQATSSKQQILNALFKELKEIGKNEEVSFIRINPIWERNEENEKIFKNLGFRDAPIHIHPEATWQLDIRPPEEELLKNMRKTTRYLIKKAQQDKDIEITQSSDIKDVEILSELHKKVSQHQHFVPFSQEYLKNEFLAFQNDNQPIRPIRYIQGRPEGFEGRQNQDYPEYTKGQVSLFVGKYKGKVIASAFVVFWSGKGFYHHAALLPEYSKIPISYLILWEAIREAKKRGCSFFDFWGYVSPKEQPNHPWAGPTLFKMGFGGEKREYVKAQDFPLSLLYLIDWSIEKIRKIKRRV